jgi:hypothetical protein
MVVAWVQQKQHLRVIQEYARIYVIFAYLTINADPPCTLFTFSFQILAYEAGQKGKIRVNTISAGTLFIFFWQGSKQVLFSFGNLPSEQNLSSKSIIFLQN